MSVSTCHPCSALGMFHLHELNKKQRVMCEVLYHWFDSSIQLSIPSPNAQTLISGQTERDDPGGSELYPINLTLLFLNCQSPSRPCSLSKQASPHIQRVSFFSPPSLDSRKFGISCFRKQGLTIPQPDRYQPPYCTSISQAEHHGVWHVPPLDNANKKQP